MENGIRIFKTFEEQENFRLSEMKKTTPLIRFQNLLKMQQLTNKLRKIDAPAKRKITIKNGYLK